MKKLLISILFLLIINTILLILTYSNICLNVDVISSFNKCDTIINKIRIDSIEYIIKSKDSIINKIKYDEKRNIEKANMLSDTASVELFKQLVSE